MNSDANISNGGFRFIRNTAKSPKIKPVPSGNRELKLCRPSPEYISCKSGNGISTGAVQGILEPSISITKTVSLSPSKMPFSAGDRPPENAVCGPVMATKCVAGTSLAWALARGRLKKGGDPSPRLDSLSNSKVTKGRRGMSRPHRSVPIGYANYEESRCCRLWPSEMCPSPRCILPMPGGF